MPGDLTRFDVRREIDEAPIGGYHIGLAVLVGLIVFFEGYDTFNASYVIQAVMKPWGLRPGQAGLLVSSGLIGFSLAALVHGKIADRVGRRLALIGGLWVATIFSFATAHWAHSFWSFCGWRFLTGLGLGVLLPVSVAFMNEIAPKHARATFATFGWSLGFSLGGVAASLVGLWLTPIYGWPALYYLGASSCVLAIACHALLPESPQFLAVQQRHAAVAAMLARLHPARRQQYLVPDARFLLPESTDRRASIGLLLSPRYRRATVGASVAAFCIMFGIYGLTGWAPTAMMARGETFGTSVGFGALLMGMNFIGTIVCSVLVDRYGLGKAGPMLWWTIGGAALVLLGLTRSHAMNVTAMVLGGFGIMGGQGALNNLVATWYDTEVRSTAVGTMLGIGRIGGILGPYVIGLLQQVVPGPDVVFVAIGVAAFLGAACLTVTEVTDPVS